MADLQMSGLGDSLRMILGMWASETEARLEGEEHFFNIQNTDLEGLRALEWTPNAGVNI